MKNSLLVAATAALAATAAPAMADGDVQGDGTARSRVKPARLIEFTGDREFLKSASRLRVWRGDVGYTLQVDDAGKPVTCEITEKFRRTYVNETLCDVLLKHHSFEPAEDASGAAVEGSYEGRLNFMELRDRK